MSILESYMSVKVAVLGASSGLGFEVTKVLLGKGMDLWVGSRKANVVWGSEVDGIVALSADFSKKLDQDSVLDSLNQFQPDFIVYVAGGGPFGVYSQKQWKDHLWAFEVSFIFPARLMHFVRNKMPCVKRMVIVGSKVAENAPDPLAASYCAAKHALRGLITTLEAESGDGRVELFSPGYMDTRMLPPNSFPRKNNLVLADPKKVAIELVKLLLRDE